MQHSVNPRIVKFFYSVLLNRGIIAFRQIAIVPLLLHFWGVEYFGDWLVLSTIPGFLALSNLGLGTAGSIKTGIYASGGELPKANEIFATAFFGLVAISVFVVVVCACLFAFVFPSPSLNIQHASAIVPLLVIQPLTRMAGECCKGWWVGSGKPHIANSWFNSVAALETFYIAFSAFFGFHALEVALGWAVIDLVWLLLFLTETSRVARHLGGEISPRNFRSKLMRQVFLSGTGHLLTPLWQAVYFQGTILLAAFLFGSTSAALWGAVRTATRSGAQLLELVSITLGPEFMKLYGEGNWRQLNTVYSTGLVLSILVSLPVAVLGVVFLPQVFDIWTNHKFEVPRGVWAPILASLVPYSCWRIGDAMLRNFDMPWRVNVFALISAVGALLFVFLVPATVVTLAYASMFFEVIMACAVSFAVSKTLGISIAETISIGTKGVGTLTIRYLNRFGIAGK